MDFFYKYLRKLKARRSKSDIIRQLVAYNHRLMKHVLKPIGYMRLCLKAEMNLSVLYQYQENSLQDLYRVRQVSQRVHELGLRGTVANWRIHLFCLKVADYLCVGRQAKYC